jgi:NADH-ubiquinone oxidoreductase chain 6
MKKLKMQKVIIKKKKKITMKNVLIYLLVFGALVSSVSSITSKNPVISVIYLIATFVQLAVVLVLLGINFVGISYIVVYVGSIAVLFLFVIMMIEIKLIDIIETGLDFTQNLPLAISIVVLSLIVIYNVLQYGLINNPSIILNKITILYTFFYDFNFNSAQATLTVSSAEALAKGANALHVSKTIFDSFTLNLGDYLSYAYNFNADILITTFEQIEILGHSLYTYGAILLIILSVILLLAMFAIIIISKSNKNN